MEAEGLIRAEWGISETNRKARFYELTAAGRKRLTEEREHWERITAAVNIVLKNA
jgi:DNA-binding PadR family transcriptional regulator